MRRRVIASLFAVLALVLSACELRLTAPPGEGDVRYRDQVFSSVDKTADLTYGSAVNQTGQTVSLKMDLYEPAGDANSTRPVIVLVHGGSFKSGNKTSPEIVDQANVYAKQGFVTASISYRLSANGCTSVNAECVTAIQHAKFDAQAAVRYLRSQAAILGLDSTRISIAGTSAGAITAIEVAYGSNTVGTSGNPGYSSQVSSAVSLSGAMFLTTPDPGEPGVLLFHGTSDTIVAYAWATATVTAAEAAGTTIEATYWPGEGHVPYVAHRTEILTQTSNFLWWTMNLKNAAT